MKGLLHVVMALTVMGLAFWAYRENYATQAALREVRQLHAGIGAAHARLDVLQAEWAYLNRPDRLRELSLVNFERLGLLPLAPESFGQVEDIARPPAPLGSLTDPVALSAPLNPNEEPL